MKRYSSSGNAPIFIPQKVSASIVAPVTRSTAKLSKTDPITKRDARTNKACLMIQRLEV